jgi:MFS family permease
MNSSLTKNTAIKLVILLGIVSLFADVTYEGARSITGQYLATLGANGTVVGIVAGLGEFIGYGFRLVSGYISDKTGRYWLITFIGYVLNLIAVPLLALAGNWPLAAGLIILERFGKAIRSPSKDAILSYATHETGRGWGFGLHEAMDQIGAIAGPLIVSAVLYYQGSYQMSFALLLIPAVCALGVLAAARVLYPRPQDLEIENLRIQSEGFSKKYWFYIAAVSCVAAGYVDFSLIAYHFEKGGVIPDIWIPIFFSIAMAADGLAALVFGRLYDSKGISIVIVATAISSFFAPLVFADGFYFALFGMILWGIGLGSQESIMRAVVANLVSVDKRGTAYGTLNIWFGVFWFLGSACMGFLYDISVAYVIVFSIVAQLLSIPIFLQTIQDGAGRTR